MKAPPMGGELALAPLRSWRVAAKPPGCPTEGAPMVRPRS